jgi:hypothetical protein
MFRSVLLATTLAMPTLGLTACSPIRGRGRCGLEGRARELPSQQGSFSVGVAQSKALACSTRPSRRTVPNEGQTLWVESDVCAVSDSCQPVGCNRLVLVHGGGGTVGLWESTPDGREGYQTIFLRRGYAMYIVDFPRRGRAGQPTFKRSLSATSMARKSFPNLTGKTGSPVRLDALAYRARSNPRTLPRTTEIPDGPGEC